MRKDSFRYLALDEPGEGDLVGEEVRLDEVPPLGAHDVGGLQVGRREVQEDGGEDVGHVQPEQVVELHRREDIPPPPPRFAGFVPVDPVVFIAASCNQSCKRRRNSLAKDTEPRFG